MTQTMQKQEPKVPKVPLVVPETVKQYDKITQMIWRILIEIKVPFFAQMYIASPMLYNFMLVGASGAIIQFLLYEGIFRAIISGFLGSTGMFIGLGMFIGSAMATLCAFLWNFVWNKKWSLGVKPQLLKMSNQELENTVATIQDIIALREKQNV